MIVVSDTSPITALLTVGRADILQTLFGEVVIPSSVQRELLQGHMSLPSWFHVVEVRNGKHLQELRGVLDAGEAEAIMLAKETHAELLLLDERKGRRIAAAEGVPVIGLLGVILLAKRRGLIESAAAVVDEIRRKAGAYIADNIVRTALESVGE